MKKEFTGTEMHAICMKYRREGYLVSHINECGIRSIEISTKGDILIREFVALSSLGHMVYRYVSGPEPVAWAEVYRR